MIESKDKKFAIAIENKIWASGTGDIQLERYYNFLRENYENYKLIYLNPHGNTPEKSLIDEKLRADLEEKGYYKTMSYKEITGWLMNCKGVSQSPRVDYFLVELINYINRNIFGVRDMTEENIIIKSIIKDKESFENCIKIANSIVEAKDSLLKSLEIKLLSTKLPNNYIFTKAKYDKCGFRFINGKSPKFCLRIQLPYGGGAHFGFVSTEEDQPARFDCRNENTEFRDYLSNQNVIGVSRAKEPWWYWWNYFGDYSDIFKDNGDMNSSETWMKIKDGSYAEILLNAVDIIDSKIVDPKYRGLFYN